MVICRLEQYSVFLSLLWAGIFFLSSAAQGGGHENAQIPPNTFNHPGTANNTHHPGRCQNPPMRPIQTTPQSHFAIPIIHGNPSVQKHNKKYGHTTTRGNGQTYRSPAKTTSRSSKRREVQMLLEETAPATAADDIQRITGPNTLFARTSEPLVEEHEFYQQIVAKDVFSSLPGMPELIKLEASWPDRLFYGQAVLMLNPTTPSSVYLPLKTIVPRTSELSEDMVPLFLFAATILAHHQEKESPQLATLIKQLKEKSSSASGEILYSWLEKYLGSETNDISEYIQSFQQLKEKFEALQHPPRTALTYFKLAGALIISWKTEAYRQVQKEGSVDLDPYLRWDGKKSGKRAAMAYAESLDNTLTLLQTMTLQ